MNDDSHDGANGGIAVVEKVKVQGHGKVMSLVISSWRCVEERRSGYTFQIFAVGSGMQETRGWYNHNV